LRHASIFRFAKLPHYHALLSEPFSFACTRLHYAELGSTNSLARELLHSGIPADRTLVTADRQTAGRGQRDRKWFSEAGANITCSYILRPQFLPAQRQFLLGAAVALAVRDTVIGLLPGAAHAVSIKWPNDILISRAKVAGILIENSLRGSVLDTAIVGIGLNVNQGHFPDGLSATSLSLCSGEKWDAEQVLRELDRQLGFQYERLRGLRQAEIMADYNHRLFGTARLVTIGVNGRPQQVEVLGAMDSGLLRLRHADGTVSEHAHHELDWADVLTPY